MRTVLSTICLLAGVTNAATAQTAEEISRRINAQDCAGLLSVVTERAKASDPVGQRQLAAMYYWGCGTDRDTGPALSWCSAAADKGDAIAADMIGRIYETGYAGLNADLTVATQWFRKAADRGNADADKKLAWLTENGWGGLARDLGQAMVWWQTAATGAMRKVRPG